MAREERNATVKTQCTVPTKDALYYIIGSQNYRKRASCNVFSDADNGVILWFCITHIKCKIMSPKLDYNLAHCHWPGMFVVLYTVRV